MSDASPAAPLSLAALVRTAVERSLTEEEAEAAFHEIMRGRGTPVLIAALLAAIRVRGATAAEVAGGVRALRGVMVPVGVAAADGLVDTCGTGGGSVTTFNISTAAALVVAGAGGRVAKHGNRSFSSRSGSADVLEALGIRIDLDPADQAEVLSEVGIAFLFAPRHHPAMRHVAPVRREMAVPTLMNILGPLTNPAGVRRQIVGVSDPDLLPLVADALRILGHDRALVVHGEPGMDEMSPLGSTRVVELREGEVESWVFDPARELGWTDSRAEELAGGEPEDNARIIEAVLTGSAPETALRAVLLNAGAALYAAGLAESVTRGVERAREAVGSGEARTRLEMLREATRRLSREAGDD